MPVISPSVPSHKVEPFSTALGGVMEAELRKSLTCFPAVLDVVKP